MWTFPFFFGTLEKYDKLHIANMQSLYGAPPAPRCSTAISINFNHNDFFFVVFAAYSVVEWIFSSTASQRAQCAIGKKSRIRASRLRAVRSYRLYIT